MAAVRGARTFRRMPRRRLAALIVAATAVPAAPAAASWSPPRAAPGSGPADAGAPVLAVDGRGDLPRHGSTTPATSDPFVIRL
jgi:hypothetical protein